MHEEVKTIENSLQRCVERVYCLLDDEMRGLLNKHLSAVVDVLYDKYPQDKYPGNNGRFLRAKNMALVLYDILAAKDESELGGYKNNFKEKFTALLELYSLSKEDDCKAAMLEVKETFAGRWMGLTRENLTYYEMHISSAEIDPNRANELPGLRINMEIAKSLRGEVEGFIHQQAKLTI